MLRPRWLFRRYLTPAARLSLAAGGALLVVALLGAIVNPFIGNRFQSLGLAIVGLFYMLLFVCNFATGGTRFLGTSEILSTRCDDNDEEAVQLPRRETAKHPDPTENYR